MKMLTGAVERESLMSIGGTKQIKVLDVGSQGLVVNVPFSLVQTGAQ